MEFLATKKNGKYAFNRPLRDNRVVHRFQSIFYGWWILIGCVLISAIAGGVAFHLFSLIASEVEVAFSSSRTVVMLCLTGHGVAMSLLAPKLGSLLDQTSIKKVVLACAFIMGGGFFAMTLSPSIWGVVAAYTFLIPLGSATFGILFSPLLLSRWFSKHRGFAIGIAAAGTNLGGALIPPIVAALIEATDWRFALRVVGVFVTVVISFIALLVIVDRPSDKGLKPDGDTSPIANPTDDTSELHKKMARFEAMKRIFLDRNFWIATGGIAALGIMLGIVMGNLALFARDIGIPRDQAALLISAFAIAGLITAPLMGRACDIVDLRIVFSVLLLIGIFAVGLYLSAHGFKGLVLATIMAAIVSGGLMPFWASLVGRLFDSHMYGRAMGCMLLVMGVSGAAAPPLSGYLFDISGTYNIVFIGLIVLMIFPLPFIPFLKIRGH